MSRRSSPPPRSPNATGLAAMTIGGFREPARLRRVASPLVCNGRVCWQELRDIDSKNREKKRADLTFSPLGVRMNMCHEHYARDLTLPSDSGLGSPPPDRCTFS
jgi:hypothetical protein